MERRAKEQKGIEYYMGLPYSILLHELEEEGKKYWIAEVPELPGCKSHGSSVEEAVKSVEEAKRDWILDSLKEGEIVPTPIERESYSGRMLVRMSRSLHRSLALIAESERLSLNQLIVTILAKEAGRLNVLNRVEDKVDNLLHKIDKVLEEGSLGLPFSRLVRVTGQSQELEQIATLDQDFILKYVDEAAGVGAFVTTKSPFEDLWRYQAPYPNPVIQEPIFSADKAGEEKTEKVKHT
jgi:antitoxin HicB